MKTQQNLLAPTRATHIKMRKKIIIIGDGPSQILQSSQKKKFYRKKSNGLLSILSLRFKPNTKKIVSEVSIRNLNKIKKR
jgi:hypothetical protein